MINVYDWCDLCIDCDYPVEIWDSTSEKVVFSGTMEDAKYSDYAYNTVESMDAPYDGKITLNITVE